MKHFFLLLSMVVFCIQASFANDTACDSMAVTMVRYEQNWDDTEGTLSLRNHTKQTICNVIKKPPFETLYTKHSN